ncbi:MAG: MarR family winged helix-turn-helix transcriptional regulator [Paracoccaceae bacterium]
MSQTTTPLPAYSLDRQVGFLLRKATQRHIAIFAARIPSLTPTQFAALAKLCELGPTSQNALGRATAMDAATIKGVVDRLRQKGLVGNVADNGDRRRIVLAPTAEGQGAFEGLAQAARAITEETLAPLSGSERTRLAELLRKLG